jgi:hypothetical protein
MRFAPSPVLTAPARNNAWATTTKAARASAVRGKDATPVRRRRSCSPVRYPWANWHNSSTLCSGAGPGLQPVTGHLRRPDCSAPTSCVGGVGGGHGPKGQKRGSPQEERFLADGCDSARRDRRGDRGLAATVEAEREHPGGARERHAGRVPGDGRASPRWWRTRSLGRRPCGTRTTPRPIRPGPRRCERADVTIGHHRYRGLGVDEVRLPELPIATDPGQIQCAVDTSAISLLGSEPSSVQLPS